MKRPATTRTSYTSNTVKRAILGIGADPSPIVIQAYRLMLTTFNNENHLPALLTLGWVESRECSRFVGKYTVAEK